MDKYQYNSFSQFYQFYLSQHENRYCKILHLLGTSSVLLIIFYSISNLNNKLLIYVPLFGYIPAWIGHFFFEKNKPATFKYPVYSLLADFVMYKDIILGKIKI
mgnify:FL=1